jgi:lactoylglutathione lyase
VTKKAAQRNFAPSSGSTFSHIGLVVENLAAAEKRFDAMNVNIVKRPGAMDTSAETADAAFAAAFGFADLSNEETLKDFAAILPGLKANGFVDHVLMIKDPDGNLIEVMPQTSVRQLNAVLCRTMTNENSCCNEEIAPLIERLVHLH